jgi:hypothetical protein
MRLVFERTRTWAMASCLFCSGGIAPAQAGSAVAPAISGGVEYFHLKELGSNGSRLLAETGARYAISAALDNASRYDRLAPWLYHAEITAYTGQVDYDGVSQSTDPTQNNLPFGTDTNYLGARAEALLGYRVKPAALSHALELIAGLGLDGWRRRIHTGFTANSTRVSGTEEIYRVFYGKAALGLTDLWSGGWHNQLQAGVKLPIRIDEEVHLRAVGYDNDLNLVPANAYSGFARLTLEAPHSPGAGGGNLLLSLYYEGLRFDPSPSKLVSRGDTLVSVWQPATHIDVFGVQVGYRF